MSSVITISGAIKKYVVSFIIHCNPIVRKVKELSTWQNFNHHFLCQTQIMLNGMCKNMLATSVYSQDDPLQWCHWESACLWVSEIMMMNHVSCRNSPHATIQSHLASSTSSCQTQTLLSALHRNVPVTISSQSWIPNLMLLAFCMSRIVSLTKVTKSCACQEANT